MKAWIALAWLALLVVGGVNVGSTLQRVPPAPRASVAGGRDVVMRHEQRMAALRRALQARDVRGTIGYVADVPAPELAAAPRGREEYFLTQFALTPWRLDVDLRSCDWAVANLHRATLAERLPAGFQVSDALGDGVWLLRKTNRAAP